MGFFQQVLLNFKLNLTNSDNTISDMVFAGISRKDDDLLNQIEEHEKIQRHIDTFRKEHENNIFELRKALGGNKKSEILKQFEKEAKEYTEKFLKEVEKNKTQYMNKMKKELSLIEKKLSEKAKKGEIKIRKKVVPKVKKTIKKVKKEIKNKKPLIKKSIKKFEGTIMKKTVVRKDSKKK